MKKIILDLPGKTKEELWDNLTALVCAACQSKNDSESKEMPEIISLSGDGTLRIVDEDKAVKTRMERYESLMKEAAMFLQNSENPRAQDLAHILWGSIIN